MKKEAHIMCGLPGCGKSTKVYELIGDIPGIQVIGYDSIRAALGVNGHDSNSYNPSIEPTVRYIVEHMKLAHLRAGLSVILDDTHTYPSNIENQMNFFCCRGYEVHVWYFDVPGHTCRRARPLIGAAVYRRMQAQLSDSLVSINGYEEMKLITKHVVTR